MTESLVGRRGQTFPAAHRLKNRQDFLQCKKMGRKVHTSHFLIFIEQHQRPGPSRLGLTVSRKVGNAVVRNRVKRLVREFFRTRYHQLAANCSYSVIAKRNAGEIEFEDLCCQLQVILKQ
ncbi:ribonuclease P protein component [Geothermobacter hydrogeniphilus]|uniref:Ribonuclease P protein component n=2 Tax=Geothermobacter hydrogeniphilus TaxID=1969733 RepID=A0A1X0XZF8_9BACT|nr:ribonuclease P protein component [Geothermobacter hydrogeniphilus]